MKPLLFQYAFCPKTQDYYAPNDARAKKNEMFIGADQVGIRASTLNRLHYFRPGGGGGATGPETAAHIFAKMYLKREMRFYGVVDGERTLVQFRSCALEQRMDVRTPDVTAVVEHAWPPRYLPGSTFLIEIHATNAATRDPGRIPALRALGHPCVEVTLPPKAVEWDFEGDDPLVARGDFEAYMESVMSMPYHATWLVPENVEPYPTAPESVRFLPRS